MAPVSVEGTRVVIEGVPRIAWDTGEMCEFASALVAAMRRLGEPVTYPYVMGVSGAAFRFTLNPGAWDYGNYSIRSISDDPAEPVRRALDAVGYGYTLREPGAPDEDAARICASLRAGVPVLAYGVVGPADCCVIAGYDDGGSVLLGWSTYQDIPNDHPYPHDATGYFRRPSWHSTLRGYILLGPRREPRPRRAIFLDALRWAVHLVRTRAFGDRLAGLAAMRVWASEMRQDSSFPPGDEATLADRYVSTTINMTMLRDHGSAAPFLAQVAAEEADLAPLLAPAIGCYEEGAHLYRRLDRLISDDFSPAAMGAIGDAQRRQAFADVILAIADREEAAAVALEELLRRQGA